MLTRHSDESDHVTILHIHVDDFAAIVVCRAAAEFVGRERRGVDAMAHPLVKKAAIKPHTGGVRLSLLLMCSWSDDARDFR